VDAVHTSSLAMAKEKGPMRVREFRKFRSILLERSAESPELQEQRILVENFI
jgi:hypothetical protein